MDSQPRLLSVLSPHGCSQSHSLLKQTRILYSRPCGHNSQVLGVLSQSLPALRFWIRNRFQSSITVHLTFAVIPLKVNGTQTRSIPVLSARRVTPAFSWPDGTPRNRFPPLRYRLGPQLPITPRAPLTLSQIQNARSWHCGSNSAQHSFSDSHTRGLQFALAEDQKPRFRPLPLHLTVLPLNVDGLATALTFRS